MPSVKRSALVSYSALKMYELVNDVERYPEFLPWCGGAHIVEKEGDHSSIASITISFRGVNKSFTTSNQLKPGAYIKMNLVDGPFERLSGGWVFSELSEDDCRIELNLDYDFSSRLIKMAIGPVFRYITDTMVESFTRRAEKIFPS